jgi:hypothetical protein
MPARRSGALRRRLRRRAVLDAMMALLLLPMATLLSTDPYTQIRLLIVASGFAVLAFMIRRAQDFEAIRADLQARDSRMDGRGISIGAWHAGQPLAPWHQRGAVSEPPCQREPA